MALVVRTTPGPPAKPLSLMAANPTLWFFIWHARYVEREEYKEEEDRTIQPCHGNPDNLRGIDFDIIMWDCEETVFVPQILHTEDFFPIMPHG